jgi:dTMP kinase
MKGKLIAIEGTDASGKNKQTGLLFERLIKEQFSAVRSTFPRYDTPAGKIVGGPLLGKPEICTSYFSEGAGNVPAKVASAYYVADRNYNLPFIRETLDSGKHLILDRYVESNMGHQGGKIRNSEERLNFFRWLEKLEYDMFELPHPDLTVFLYMPFEVGIKLKSKMGVALDDVEKDFNYLKNSEESYLQLVEIYNWKKIDCVKNGELRTPGNIHEEVYETVREILL